MLYSIVTLFVFVLPFVSTALLSLFSLDISPQSCPLVQYETSPWEASIPVDNPNSANSRDKVIIDGSDTESWPSIGRSSDHSHSAVPECPLGSANSNQGISAVSNTCTSSFLSMATGAADQQSHYTFLKTKNSMMTGPGSANILTGNRGWGSDGKQDVINGSRTGAPNNWGSSNFNLNLNPNANPSAWPVLGHEGGGAGDIGPNGVSNSSSLPPGINDNGNIGNGSLGGADNGGGGWVGIININENDQQRSSTNTSLSLNMEPALLKTDQPNHTKQQQQAGRGGQSPTESSQLNKDTTGNSIWGSGETKAADSLKDSGWDSNPSGGLSAWGQQGSGGGSSGSGGWGDWGKSSGGVSKGWDSVDASSSGSGQEQQLSSWGPQPGPAPESEGSGDSTDGRSCHRDRSSSMDFSPMLPRQDLDPRVLSNTGWGQTPIRQHTVWEMEEVISDDGKSNSSSDTLGGSSSNGGSSSTNGGNINPNFGPSQRPGSGGKSGSEGSSSSGWGAPPPQPVQTGSGWWEQSLSKAQKGTTSGWVDPLPTSGPKNGSAPSWDSEDKTPSWDDGLMKGQPTSWGEGPKSSHGWGNSNGGSSGSSAGDWGEAEVKHNGSSSSMWEGDGGNEGSVGWKESPKVGNRGGGWGKPTPTVNSSSWGEAPHANGPVQGGWGSSKPQEGSSSSTGSGGGGSIGSWAGPGSVKQNTSKWGNSSKQDQGIEPTGWEEPSPPSIRRKMEIDDGTSTWGDPTTYNKTVNMWDRNAPNNNPGNNGPPTGRNGGVIIPNNNGNHSIGPGNNNHHLAHHMHQHPQHGQPPTHLQHHGNNNGSPSNVASLPAAGPQGRPSLANPGNAASLCRFV